MRKIRTMIADDQKMYRQGLSHILTTDKIEVIGLAENGKVLLEMISQDIPDIVILDLTMPVMGGEEALRIISSDYPSVRTIIVSMDYTDFLAADAIIGGAAAYLQKEDVLNQLVEAVETVYDFGHYFNNIITEEILHRFKSEKKIYYLIENKRFSLREIEVLKQLCEDLTQGQIADNLNIAESTLRYHKRNLLEKTESETTISLLKFAVRQKIINVERI